MFDYNIKEYSTNEIKCIECNNNFKNKIDNDVNIYKFINKTFFIIHVSIKIEILI
jgi:hypothetical protein